MSWLGLVWRSSGIMKDALNWKPEGKRLRGRPKKRWMDSPHHNFRILGIDNLEESANDREEWWRLCGLLMGQPFRRFYLVLAAPDLSVSCE